jgi:hypothetical protein
MTWLAATFQDQLNEGTELAVFKKPCKPGATLPEQLPPSVELGVDFASGAQWRDRAGAAPESPGSTKV